MAVRSSKTIDSGKSVSTRSSFPACHSEPDSESKENLEKPKSTSKRESKTKQRNSTIKTPDQADKILEIRQPKNITTNLTESESSLSLENNDPLKLAFDKIKEHYDSLALKTLFDEIIKKGICPNEDERMAPIRESLNNKYKSRRLNDIIINYEMFKKITQPVGPLLMKILNNNLAIKNIEEWTQCLSICYEAVKEMTGKDFAVSLTSADGQKIVWGQTKKLFSLNELLHIVIYLIATDSLGFNKIHEAIDLKAKPSSEWAPENPLVGAGALAVATFLVNQALRNKNSTERHEIVKKIIGDLSGGANVLFDSKTFVGSERKGEYLKAVLSWMIGREMNGYATCKDVDKIVQFYLECSSLQIDVEALSVLGASLANGGICATTAKKILCCECIEKVLSVMTISSGKPGVPLIASSSGAVLLVVPAILGLAVHSEDPSAPSYFVSSLFRHFALNPYERIFLRDGPQKTCIPCPESALFVSARNGDLLTLSSLIDYGICLKTRDYMSRTVLHVAASLGHLNYIKFLLKFSPQLVTTTDITGRTALDEARFFNKPATVQFLESWEILTQNQTEKKSLKTKPSNE